MTSFIGSEKRRTCLCLLYAPLKAPHTQQSSGLRSRLLGGMSFIRVKRKDFLAANVCAEFEAMHIPRRPDAK